MNLVFKTVYIMSEINHLLQRLSVKSFAKIDEINTSQWNSLVPDNYPFIKHEFLSALEKHECVGKQYGWLPRHLAVFENDKLVAALPVYEKHNYYGEFVFDHAWEQAWNQVGLPYYPKLVSAMPYTPAHGPRLLFDNNFPKLDELKQLLMNALEGLCIQTHNSGYHLLFADHQQQAWLQKQPTLLHRHGYQFHWFNQSYESFDHFLNVLTAKKRKNIRQERKAVIQDGIEFKIMNGHTATQEDWEDFGYFYQKTFVEKWSTPTLNTGFFTDIAKTMPDQIILVMALKNGRNIAGSLMFKSDHTLFGRHWGCIENIKHLHFETCYYQGIEFAIENGLKVFEPGAGGEHKLARGFVPIKTLSSHWLANNPFEQGIKHFISEEARLVDEYIADCNQHSPYK